MKNILALIPARKGSTRIKNKNIIKIYGKPLIEFSIDVAKKSKLISDIYISSDSNVIKRISKKNKCNYIDRPKKLSQNKTEMIDVINHAYEFFEKKFIKCDLLVLLQPTSPIRKEKEIDNAIRFYLKNIKADSLVSVNKVSHCYLNEFLMIEEKNYLKIYKNKKINNLENIKKNKKLYARNGPSIFITRLKKFKNRNIYDNKILPYEMDKVSSIDINTYEDLKLAKLVLKDKFDK